MRILDNKPKLGFDDILLVPRYSELRSRTQPDISMVLGSDEHNIGLKNPIISSPMDSITGSTMLAAMNSVGGLGILSRYISLSRNDELNRQCHEISTAIMINGSSNIGCAIGIHDSLAKTKELLKVKCKVICVDVAHCDHFLAHQAIAQIVAHRYKMGLKFVLMAGNVCTKDATQRLIDLGVDVIKCGVGAGAVCSTRNITGFGVPQLSAILECCEAIEEHDYKVSLVADGGLRSTGDLVKSLWAGADACMVGYMLAGTDCTPDIDGKKVYRGMSSRNVSCRDDVAPEGINIAMDYQGETVKKLQDFVKGIKSGLAMGGCNTIGDLREHVQAVRLSVASMKENLTL